MKNKIVLRILIVVLPEQIKYLKFISFFEQYFTSLPSPPVKEQLRCFGMRRMMMRLAALRRLRPACVASCCDRLRPLAWGGREDGGSSIDRKRGKSRLSLAVIIIIIIILIDVLG